MLAGARQLSDGSDGAFPQQLFARELKGHMPQQLNAPAEKKDDHTTCAAAREDVLRGVL